MFVILFALTTASCLLTCESADFVNRTAEADTAEDLAPICGGGWCAGRYLEYAASISEIFYQTANYSNDLELPKEGDLEDLKTLTGLWYTVWNGYFSKPPREASMQYSSNNQALDYLSIRYALCGDSNITVIAGGSEVVTFVNTPKDDGNFSCDSEVKEHHLSLAQAFNVKVSLNANTKASLVMIDKLTYAQEVPVTEEPDTKPPRSTKFTQEPPNTDAPGITPTTSSPSSTSPNSGSAMEMNTHFLCAASLAALIRVSLH